MGAVHLESVWDSGEFDFRWPATNETFSSGWEAIAVWGGRRFKFAHGVGARDVYGARRIHTVTFVDSHAVVEGVAADDFEVSRSLLSLIKPGPGHALARSRHEVPPEYLDYEVVDHRDQIDAQYSHRCVALKIRVDDLEAWAFHALVRRERQGRL